MLISITERRREEPDAGGGAREASIERTIPTSLQNFREFFVLLLLPSSCFPSLFQWVIASKKLALRSITLSTPSLIQVISSFPLFPFRFLFHGLLFFLLGLFPFGFFVIVTFWVSLFRCVAKWVFLDEPLVGIFPLFRHFVAWLNPT